MRGTKTNFPSYLQYSLQHLLDAYERAPGRIRGAIAGLNEEDLRARARGDATWSIQEIVMHVTDSELQGAYRIRKAWSETGTPLPLFNENLWTMHLNHQKASAEAREISLTLFAALRASTVPLLRSAGEVELGERRAIHPEYGSLTVRNLMELYADHVERHIQQILTIRELIDKKIEFPLLLPERLY